MLISDEVQADALAEVLQRGESTRVRLHGGSMLPTVFPGGIVPVEPVIPAECVPGDVVLVRNDSGFTAHRWVGGEPGRWVLQGDASDEPDRPVSDERVFGRVAGLLIGRWVIPIPAPLRTRISGQLLRAMPTLRRTSKRVRAAVRGPVRGVQEAEAIHRLRRRLQSWTLERFEVRHMPEIRRALLRRGQRPTRAVLDAWTMLADSGHGVAFVACVGDRIVGHASIGRDPTDRQLGRHGYLWVDRWYRSLGIAGALKRACVEHAREAGYRELVTRARWGSDSMRASQRVGFVATRSEDGQFADLRLVLRT